MYYRPSSLVCSLGVKSPYHKEISCSGGLLNYIDNHSFIYNSVNNNNVVYIHEQCFHKISYLKFYHDVLHFILLYICLSVSI